MEFCLLSLGHFKKLLSPLLYFRKKEYSCFSCCLKCSVEMNDCSQSLWVCHENDAKHPQFSMSKTKFFEITLRVTYLKKSHFHVNFLSLGKEMLSEKCSKC